LHPVLHKGSTTNSYEKATLLRMSIVLNFKKYFLAYVKIKLQ